MLPWKPVLPLGGRFQHDFELDVTWHRSAREKLAVFAHYEKREQRFSVKKIKKSSPQITERKDIFDILDSVAENNVMPSLVKLDKVCSLASLS